MSQYREKDDIAHSCSRGMEKEDVPAGKVLVHFPTVLLVELVFPAAFTVLIP
jgi:hypothetical protein